MSRRPTRVIIYGCGAMGGLMARLLQGKEDAEVVAAIDHDPAKVGRDLGNVIGLSKPMRVPVEWPPQNVLERLEADVVLLATTAFAREALPAIQSIVARRMNVVCIVQELFFPIGDSVHIARAIDEAARESGVAVVSVGINPGFILDVLPAVCSLPCWQIESIVARRTVDFSPYGPDEMVHIGANLSREEFQRGAAEGSIGHIGLLESAAFVAHCCGIAVDELHQTKEPLIAERPLQTAFVKIDNGGVRGFKQRVVGIRRQRPVLDFQMVGILDPTGDGANFELGDHLRINGTPSIDIRIKEEVSQKGGLGTAAVAVNTIPRVLSAAPGFHTVDRLAMPHIWPAASGLPAQITIVPTLKQ